MLATAMKRSTRRILSLLLTVGALAVLGVGALPARADVCFGGGHYENSRDAQPDGADAGDGQVVGFRRGARTRRTTGTGLVLAAGLGLAWIGGRRKNRIRAEDRRPPTERSP